MLLYYGVDFDLRLLAAPPIVLAFALLAAGFSAGLGALNVAYRDLGHVIPLALQVLFYATPIVYPSGIAPGPFAQMLRFNPLTSLIEGFRAALLGRPLDGWALTYSFSSALVIFAIGTLYFQRAERRFADVV